MHEAVAIDMKSKKNTAFFLVWHGYGVNCGRPGTIVGRMSASGSASYEITEDIDPAGRGW